MTRTAKLLLVPILALQMLFFIFIARHRLIGRDEGFYLLASRLVLTHQEPYVDFFFPQAPLLPCVYALWMKCTAASWASARTFSGLLTALLGTLLYGHVCQQTRRWLAGLVAVILFASSTLVFVWFPMVKTHSLAALLLFCAYLVASRLSAESSRWLIAAGGLLLGLSVDTRSYLLLVTTVFVWWICYNSDTRKRLVSILWLLGGFIIGVVPCLYLFISSPSAFLFDNLGYHAIRSSAGLVGMWGEKLVVLMMLFLGRAGCNGIQDSVLLFITLGLIFSRRRQSDIPRFAFQIGIAIAFISFLPTPVLTEYFSLCLPFLLVAAVCVVNDLLSEMESQRERLLAAAACVAVLGIYLGASVNDFGKYVVIDHGTAVQRASDEDDWGLQRVIKVSHAISQIAGPGEMVASFWPGDIFETKANPLPGLENDFGLPISEKLTPEQRAQYHILSPSEIETSFAAHVARVVVLRDQLSAPTPEDADRMRRMGDSFRSSLRVHGYTLVRAIGGISIYVYYPKV